MHRSYPSHTSSSIPRCKGPVCWRTIKARRLLLGAALCGLILPPLGTATAAGGLAGAPRLPVVATTLGHPPRNCSPTTLIHQTTTGGWVGGGALIGYSRWTVHNHRATLLFGARSRYGFGEKVFWELAHGARGPVTLRGWDARTRQPIWFGRPSPNAHPRPLVPPPVIGWQTAVIPGNHAPTFVFVPAAGCYVLRAQWRTGSWQATFAAGCGPIDPGACRDKRKA